MKLTLRQQLKHAQDEAHGFKTNWRLALADRDKEIEALRAATIYLDKVLGQRNRVAYRLRELLESNQLLRDARLTKRGKQVIDGRIGGLAYAEQQAREALAAI
jgi:hypothetical protein